ncbi:TonB C-terminal domain-containing protein [bacterium]|nr:TonB C-terminal domain-containing protein [bacterium]MBQ9246914.1 TonB C-terminal domain-containing protein [bacterium]
MNKTNRIVTLTISAIVFFSLLVGVFGSYAAAKSLSSSAKQDTKIENPDIFKDYMRNMQKKIKSNWIPPKQSTSKRVVLLYSIKRNGELGKYEVLETSGDFNMDNAAVRALKKSAPFGKLPKEFKGDHVDVQFSFDYNLWDKNNNKI